VPDSELIQRLKQWGSTRAGVTEVIQGLQARGYFRDAGFVRQCVQDLDGADVARIDIVAVDNFLMTAVPPANEELRKAVRRARAESTLWQQRRAVAEMPGDRP
jgi:hypothetical protein